MSHHSPRRSEAGSAYIIALLVLVVLSILGLSLALISQTEMQIGANDLTAHRTFYGSEGGFNQALARLLTVNSSIAGAGVSGDDPTKYIVETMKYIVPETRWTLDYSADPLDPPPIIDTAQATKFGERVEISPFIPVRAVPCDLCPAAEGDVRLVNVSHSVVTTSGRITWVGAMPIDPTEIEALTRTAQKQVYLQVGVQPWWEPRWEAVADEVEQSKVVQQTLGAQ
jgi:hypothetical protein